LTGIPKAANDELRDVIGAPAEEAGTESPGWLPDLARRDTRKPPRPAVGSGQRHQFDLTR
jgi:hypothetical protein